MLPSQLEMDVDTNGLTEVLTFDERTPKLTGRLDRTAEENRSAAASQLMIGLVLATDVTTHIPFMKDFNASVASGTPVGAEKATQLCLKAADISNPTRPIGVYETWVEGVMAEFFAQGDAEKALGLPVSMNCDRDTVDVNKCQVGFISFIVGPIFEGFAKAVPEISEVCLKALAANKAHYQAKAA